MKAKKLFWVATLLILSLGAGVPGFGAETFEGYRMEDSVINVASTTGKAVVSITVEHVTKLGSSPSMCRLLFSDDVSNL